MDEPRNHLTDRACTAPGNYMQTMTTKELRATLLYTEGFITARGEIWSIKPTHLGAGVHRVRLERRH